MYQVTQENKTPWPELIGQTQQLFTGALIGQRPQLSTATLRPAVAQVNVGKYNGFRLWNPKRTRRMRP
jgi:hypothetical protein